MATLTYYTFSKRHKSTLQPLSGSDYDVILKDGCSLTKPVFLLEISGAPTFNYCQFEGRYYFVTDIRSVRNNLWEIECEEDYLASWKTDIGSTIAMVLYASGGRSDIVDNRIPITDAVYVSHSTGYLSGIDILDDTIGAVVLSITGTGSFGNYVLQNGSNVYELLRDIDLWTAGNIVDVATGFQQLISNGAAADNIKSAIALPIICANMTAGNLEDLYLGNYPCTNAGGSPIKGYRVSRPVGDAYATINIPWRHSDWRKHSPYTSLYLYLPLIGTCTLPVDDLVNDTSIEVQYSINITSGDISAVVVGSQSGRFIGTFSSNCAMATPFGSSNISGQKIASAAVTGASGILGAAALSNPAGATAALFAGLAGSAVGMLNASHGETSGGGGLGGGASQGLPHEIRLTSVSKDLTDTQANLDGIMGKPVMIKTTIGSYSGFVQTDGAQVAGNMLDSEREVINSLLDGGIYYE